MVRHCLVVAVVFAAGVLAGPTAAQAQTGAAAAADATPAPQIKVELEKIKKGRTLGLNPALGIENADGATELQLDNPSPFNIVVLVVGPTSRRVEIGPMRMETLAISPGDYEVAVTVIGRDLPPFYGKQTIVAGMHFRHQFLIPLI